MLEKFIKTLEGNFPFITNQNLVNYWIIKSDSLGNFHRLSTGSYINIKTEYREHNYTPLDGYYIVEVLSTIQRVVK